MQTELTTKEGGLSAAGFMFWAERAREYDDTQLSGAYLDACDAAKIFKGRPEEGKYLDQCSVFRGEINAREQEATQ